jgi:hypothetical protein
VVKPLVFWWFSGFSSDSYKTDNFDTLSTLSKLFSQAVPVPPPTIQEFSFLHESNNKFVGKSAKQQLKISCVSTLSANLHNPIIINEIADKPGRFRKSARKQDY